MKTVTAIGAILLALVLLVFFFAHQSTVQSVKTAARTHVPVHLSSADGVVDVSIPSDALPAGVHPSDVRVRKVARDVSATTTSGIETGTVTVYALEPAGLKLTKPATLTMNLRYDGTRGLPETFLVSTSSKTIEPLPDFLGTVNTNSNGMKVTGTVSEFGDIFTAYSQQFVNFFAYNYHDVGTPFAAKSSILIGRNVLTNIFHPEATDSWVFYKDYYDIDGTMHVDSGPVTPAEIQKVPTGAEYATGKDINSAGSFTCTTGGQATLSYRLVLTRYFDTTWTADTTLGVFARQFTFANPGTFNWPYILTANITCNGPATPSASSTSTTSSTSTGQ